MQAWVIFTAVSEGAKQQETKMIQQEQHQWISKKSFKNFLANCSKLVLQKEDNGENAGMRWNLQLLQKFRDDKKKTLQC